MRNAKAATSYAVPIGIALLTLLNARTISTVVSVALGTALHLPSMTESAPQSHAKAVTLDYLVE